MRKFLIIFLLLTSVCWAEEIEVKGNKYVDKTGKEYAVTEIPLVSDYSYKKPVIDETKILTKDEQDVVEFSLKENGRKLVHKELRHLKNDYKNDFDRGTVEYTPKCRNYSFHKVVILDGTIIRETNFTQKEPYTIAIQGKDLTFINCNLTNNIIDPTWIVNGKHIERTTQLKFIKKSETDLGNGMKKIIVSLQVQEDKPDGKFVELKEDEEIYNNIDSYDLAILRLNTK
jgi:hypothetical protein